MEMLHTIHSWTLSSIDFSSIQTSNCCSVLSWMITGKEKGRESVSKKENPPSLTR